MNSSANDHRYTRREVKFQSFEDVLADLEVIRSQSHIDIGKLTKGQIFKHLAESVRGSLEGFPVSLMGLWIIRKIIGPLLKKRILHQKMMSGIKLPKKAVEYQPDREEFDEEESILEYQEMIKKYQKLGSVLNHPYIGKMGPEEWTLLHLRHAELHLSFVVPTADLESIS